MLNGINHNVSTEELIGSVSTEKLISIDHSISTEDLIGSDHNVSTERGDVLLVYACVRFCTTSRMQQATLQLSIYLT